MTTHVDVPDRKLAWRAHGTARRSTHVLRLRVSAALVSVTVLAVLLVPPLVQLDQQAVDLAVKLEPPSWAHPFGTDDVGRDLLLRCVYGLRVSLLVGVVAALTATVIGTAVGAAAAPSAAGPTVWSCVWSTPCRPCRICCSASSSSPCSGQASGRW